MKTNNKSTLFLLPTSIYEIQKKYVTQNLNIVLIPMI